MSKYLVSKEAQSNVDLQDLSPVLREVTQSKEHWVYRYCDPRVIGREVYEDFVALNKTLMGGKDDTYAFSDDLPKEGILSMAQAFQTLATTLDSFLLDKNHALASKDRKTGKEIQRKLLRLYDEIMAAVIQPDGGYLFDASPYLPNQDYFKSNNYQFAFLESMTWVLSVVLCMFRLHIHGVLDLDEKRMDQAQKVYGYCWQYLNDSYIKGDENSGIFDCGWNYTKGCTSPSVYFTFAVSELLIDVLDTFENTVRDADLAYLHKQIDRVLGDKVSPEEIAAKKLQAEKNYGEYRKNLESDTQEARREKALFAAINQGYGVYEEGSPYWTLEQRTKKAVNKIWKLTKNQLATEFFTSDLSSTVSEEVIEQSIQSDAVFNTVFIINALINAGFDEDAADMVVYYTPNGSQAYEESLIEYDTIRDTLRLAYDNAYQFYLKMDKKKKAYKINEYTLSFDKQFKDKDKKHKDGNDKNTAKTEEQKTQDEQRRVMEEQINDLRKARIRVFSLMPQLVKTKTTLGEFLIQYPQYDMQIYLESILTHRCVRNGTQDDYFWTWERSGYSSSSNFYFLSALSDFFVYHNEYEVPASSNANKNEKARTEIRGRYLKELEKSDGRIGQLEAARSKLEQEKQSLEAEKARLEARCQELQASIDRDPLRKALSDFIDTEVRKRILSMSAVGDLLGRLAGELTASAQARVAKKAEGADAEACRNQPSTKQDWYKQPVQEEDSEVRKLEDGLRVFGSALISERLLEMWYADKLKAGKSVGDADREYPGVAEDAYLDIVEALRYYLTPRVAGQPSDYVRTQGYSGLVDLLNQRRADEKSKNNGKS